MADRVQLTSDGHKAYLEAVAISSDPQGSIVTRPFVASQGLTFPILHDSDYRVSGSYGVRTLPMSFLIDRNGTLIHRVFGARDWNSPEARDRSMGSTAPDFQLIDLQGNRQALPDYHGKVVLLNFWATWCGPFETAFCRSRNSR